MKCDLTDDEPVEVPRWVIALGARLLLLAFVVPISIAIVGFLILMGVLNQNVAVRQTQEENTARLEQMHRDVEELPKKIK